MQKMQQITCLWVYKPFFLIIFIKKIVLLAVLLAVLSFYRFTVKKIVLLVTKVLLDTTVFRLTRRKLSYSPRLLLFIFILLLLFP